MSRKGYYTGLNEKLKYYRDFLVCRGELDFFLRGVNTSLNISSNSGGVLLSVD